MAPKNSTSVTRNAHMPRRAEPCCCSIVSKWWASTPDVSADDMRLLLVARGLAVDGRADRVAVGPDLAAVDERRLGRGRQGVLVGPLDHHRHRLEVVRRRGRGGLPLQAGRAPGVRA